MIKKFDGAMAQKSTFAGAEKIPAGGYVAKIKSAHVTENSNGLQVLILLFDIVEGDYKGFFQRDYDSKKDEYPDTKWKGTVRINIPEEGKSAYFETDKKKFNNFIAAIQESNNGYTFDWDERTYKGKMIGVIFNEREYSFNGHEGTTTECRNVTDINSIRRNEFKIPRKRAAKVSPASVDDYAYLPEPGTDGANYAAEHTNSGKSAKPAEPVFVEIPTDEDDDLPF